MFNLFHLNKLTCVILRDLKAIANLLEDFLRQWQSQLGNLSGKYLVHQEHILNLIVNYALDHTFLNC